MLYFQFGFLYEKDSITYSWGCVPIWYETVEEIQRSDRKIKSNRYKETIWTDQVKKWYRRRYYYILLE